MINYIEGLWAVDFQNQMDLGSGVVVFETNRVYGGDSGWYYTGTYAVEGDEIRARVLIRHYGAPIATVTGHSPGQSFEIDMVGTFEGENRMVAVGTVVGDATAPLSFSMRRLDDLPSPGA